MANIREIVPQKLKNKKHFLTALFYHHYFGRPSRKTNIIGVTGTDGKTTTCTIIYKILQHAGIPTGLVTTISAKVGDREYDTGFHVTSPSPHALQKFLKEMVNEGIEYVVLETTSHGLDQYRVGGLRYHSATFTNVTHEHLDYHKTYEEYLKTKGKLITLVDPDKGFTVINRDDKSYDFLNELSKKGDVTSYSYGFGNEADLFATDYLEDPKHGVTQFKVNHKGDNFNVTMKLPGEYNVYNALGAIKVALEIGVKPEVIVEALSHLDNINGRWEIIQKEPIKVVVDFAHTPNALEKMLEYAREDNLNGKIHVVFGSAGKRDFEKRPSMGEAAAIYADYVYLTAEDPRGETVENISRQIAVGLKAQGKKENVDYFDIPDRREAIRAAIEKASKGDTVIVTGKGHELSMNLDGISEMPWSDQKVVREILDEVNK